MDRQASLFGGDICVQFEHFHAQNPHVYAQFKHFTFEVIRAGKTRVGAKAIWERMRWEATLYTVDDELKLNNNYTAFYARMFQRDYPQHAGIFQTRKSVSD